MTDEIVARLRLYAQKQRETKSSVLGLLLSDAADEIERLSAELVSTTNRLTAERDEARVDACRLESEARSRFARMSGMSCHYFSPKQIAKEREWDCFKEASDER